MTVAVLREKPKVVATDADFSLTLHVADVSRSADFYRALFDTEPTKQFPEYAEFAPDAFGVHLGLMKVKRYPGMPRNRIGVRLAEAEWSAVRARLALTGVDFFATNRTIEVSDPDGNALTLFVGDELPAMSLPPSPGATPTRNAWEHSVGTPIPDRIPYPDASLDEVFLQGTFNGNEPPVALAHLLSEAHRVLKPGGAVVASGLVGDVAVAGPLNLPGLAGRMRSLPAEPDPADALDAAGFADVTYEQLGDIICFRIEGIDLRKFRVRGVKPEVPI